MVLTGRRRGSSTTLDTVVFVLLIGVSIVVLGGANPTPPETGRVAEETGDVLATSTTTVEVRRSAPVGRGESITVERRSHGTYAELLAAATVANPVWIHDGLTGDGESLTAAVRSTTRRAVGTRERNVQVRAVWRPHPGSSLEAQTVVGEPPPEDASVAAAVVSVPIGFPNVTSRALAATDHGFGGVATVAARGVVDGLFPPGPTGDALFSEGPDRALVADRYRHAAEAVGTDVTTAVERGDATAANRKLAEALAVGLRGDLERRYDSPAAGARALRLDRLRIVVRTWSP